MKSVVRRSFATVVVVGALGCVIPGSASVAADTEGRFVMHQSENGMLRLDTRNGTMSLCQSRDGAWSCARIEDDSAGLEAEVRDLKRENEKLRSEISGLRNELGDQPDRLKTSERRSLIPDEKEVDRAFTFLEDMLKRFKGMVEDLRSDQPNSTPL